MNVCPSTPSPPVADPSGSPGPLTDPHQFNVASMTSLPGTGYRAPIAFPTMLFWFALLVEIVPGNWEALKKMPAPALVKPLRVKQLFVIVLFWAPLAGSVVLLKLVSVRPFRPLLSNVFFVMEDFFRAALQPVREV